MQTNSRNQKWSLFKVCSHRIGSLSVKDLEKEFGVARQSTAPNCRIVPNNCVGSHFCGPAIHLQKVLKMCLIRAYRMESCVQINSRTYTAIRHHRVVIELVRVVSRSQIWSFFKVCVVIVLVGLVSKTHKWSFGNVCVVIELVCLVLKTQK